jgi:exopolysaccharide biosynthesis polyprenyl glycosylphosphotransferase
VTTSEEALVPGPRIEDDVIRLDLLEAEAPSGWRDALTVSPAVGRRRWARSAVSLGLVATDAACILLAMALADLVSSGRDAGSVGGLFMVAACLGWVAVMTAHGLYRSFDLAGHEEFRRILGATSLGSLMVATAVLLLEPAVSRAWPLAAWLFAVGLELVARGVWRKVMDRLRRGPLRLRTVIVGINPEARRLADELTSDGSGYQLLGHVRPDDGAGDGISPLGTLGDLRGLIRKANVDCLFVASTAVDQNTAAAVARVARRERVRLCYGANIPATLTWRLGFHQVNGSLAVTVSSAGLTPARAAIKRALDLAISSMAILVAAPVLLVTAVAIRATSRGPALFRQTRVTQGGRPFTMLKFRTMRMDADPRVHEPDADPTRPFFKLRVDPRLTAVGRLIRRLSIDELPQLINVLRGDMSIVGPRPLPAEQVASNLELLGPRHEMRAGLTGWWQINGRANLAPEESVRMDIFYIENWSPSLDLYILLKTFGAVLSRRGAY